ncbi:MAG: hypothetical protein AAGG48_31710 [Planctomycetota bacterium]
MSSHKTALFGTALLIPFALLSSGCGQPSGGGGTSIDGNTVCYGIGEEGMTFVLFTDIPSDGSVTSTSASSGVSSSKVSGYVENVSGRRFNYSSDEESITIAGTSHPFSDGRVFLISMSDEELTVRQMSVEVKSTGNSSSRRSEEIQRLALDPDIAEFLKP